MGRERRGQRERASTPGHEVEGAAGTCRLCAANSNTALICSRVTSNHSMISSSVAPASRFSNTVATGIRVPRNTHSPLRLPGTLSTAAHCDQSNDIKPLTSLEAGRNASAVQTDETKQEAKVVEALIL